MQIKFLFFFPALLFLSTEMIFPQSRNRIRTAAHPADWLWQTPGIKAQAHIIGDQLILNNGLLKRTFLLKPNAACTGFKNLVSGEELLRAVKPEAEITIDSVVYAVGGLYGQPEKAYLRPEWLAKMHAGSSDFQFDSISKKQMEPLLPWKANTWAANRNQPTGVEVILHFSSHFAAVSGIGVDVHYAVYDGMPLICKWISIRNSGNRGVKLNHVVNEILATVEEESAVVGDATQMKKPHGLYVETNYAFNNAMRYDISDQTTHWKTDSSYTSQVNYNFQTPCVLEVYTEKGPGIMLNPGETFQSIRSWELLIDTYDRERRGLAIRKFYSVAAPWTTENPIFMHLVSKNDDEVRTAIDQCAETGYEALILSFGSHCNMEDSSEANIEKWKKLADYAHAKHILIGSYSLFSSRRISDEDDVIDPATGKPGGAFFGNAPCYGSRWGLAYLFKIKYFLSHTGFNLFENDGPYPGDVCASVNHPGHKGPDDSQWRQMELQKSLYRWCNQQGIYVNAPDWYFLDGTNKIALGYREVNFSLAREQQMVLNRQNIFDGTWEKTPTMSWGFVPLTKYQGGGPEAVLEPLSEHLEAYRQLMMQYYGAGIQACYRGPRLYDTEETKKMVKEVIQWVKEHREILSSDIIHLRRADGRDWDGWLHVNPNTRVKGLLMLFNPLTEAIRRTIKVPLYYTDISQSAIVKEHGGSTQKYLLNRDFTIDLPVEIKAGGYSIFYIQ